MVTPTWLVPDADAADIVITIDPQMAFGTGEHASTQPGWMEGAIQSAERVVAEVERGRSSNS